MPTHLAILHVFGGVVYLVMAGDLLVRGAVALSRRVGVSPLVVGLTVVAFGTSAPELVVSVRAALGGVPELAIGNVVGSNIANVLLVVGLPAVVYPMSCDQEGVGRDGVAMLVVSVLFVALCFAGPLGRLDGAVLLAGLVAFMAYTLRVRRGGEIPRAATGEFHRILGLPSTTRGIGLFIALGTIGLPLGAELLVRGAVGLAEAMSLPREVIGLTVVAVGTSLPELATTLVAAFKREADLAVGNVIGSNVMNILAIMGAAVVVSPAPIPVPAAFLRLDLPVMVGAAAVLTWLTVRGCTLGRPLAATLVALYLVYGIVLFHGTG